MLDVVGGFESVRAGGGFTGALQDWVFSPQICGWASEGSGRLDPSAEDPLGLWKIPSYFGLKPPFFTLSQDKGPADTPLPWGQAG